MAIRSLCVAAFVAFSAGTAMAGHIGVGSPTYPVRTVMEGPNVPGSGDIGQRSDVIVDVSGRQSWDAFGDSSNNVIMFDMAAALGLPSGTQVEVSGLGWDVEIATTPAGTFGGSWLSEARMTFGSTGTPNQLGLRPGAAVSAPGTQRFSSAVVDFSGIPLPNIMLEDGMLRIEFNETFDDAVDEVDADYLAQSFVTVRAVPAPGALALMGLGGAVAFRRRR